MNIRKRLLVATVVVAMAGAIAASAASLGNITSTNLGAADQVVASCNTDGVGVAYTTAFGPTAGPNEGLYEVTEVTVSGISELCAGQELKVTLYDVDNALLTEGIVTLDGSGAAVVDLSAVGSVPAEDVVGVAIVISGAIV